MRADDCTCGHSISRHHVNGGTVCMYLTPELACGGPCDRPAPDPRESKG